MTLSSLSWTICIRVLLRLAFVDSDFNNNLLVVRCWIWEVFSNEQAVFFFPISLSRVLIKDEINLLFKDYISLWFAFSISSWDIFLLPLLNRDGGTVAGVCDTAIVLLYTWVVADFLSLPFACLPIFALTFGIFLFHVFFGVTVRSVLEFSSTTPSAMLIYPTGSVIFLGDVRNRSSIRGELVQQRWVCQPEWYNTKLKWRKVCDQSHLCRLLVVIWDPVSFHEYIS